MWGATSGLLTSLWGALSTVTGVPGVARGRGTLGVEGGRCTRVRVRGSPVRPGLLDFGYSDCSYFSDCLLSGAAPSQLPVL